jgi:PBP1b-binding outer membrane lipoprotein LpoB
MQHNTMKNTLKRILALSMLPAAVLLFSGCGASSTSITKNPATTTTATQTVQPTTSEKVPTPAELAPFPTDNRQAIDSEISGIDQALQDNDNALSADAPDDELGL